MYYCDYHAHSNCSFDGRAPMTDMARAAVSAGLSEFCLTDHCDLLNERGERCLSYDWEPVLRQRRELLERYGYQLVLPMGLELSMSHAFPDSAREILSQPELDFVIGSIHNHNEADGGQDYYYGHYTDPETCHAALDDYFSSMEALAPLDTYDVLGHITYPLRYMNVKFGQNITLDRYWDRLRLILRTAAENGRGIELNSWTGRSIDEWLPVLELYKQCGGEIVTVGSDAHVPEGVGKGIIQLYDLLRYAGFRYVSVYRSRKPDFIKL